MIDAPKSCANTEGIERHRDALLTGSEISQRQLTDSTPDLSDVA